MLVHRHPQVGSPFFENQRALCIAHFLRHFKCACAFEMAQEMGDTERALVFEKGAADLRVAMNKHLISTKTGYYMLNWDVQGEKHHDITGDLVFPVMFGVADEPMER